jgi:hypothetical protein
MTTSITDLDLLRGWGSAIDGLLKGGAERTDSDGDVFLFAFPNAACNRIKVDYEDLIDEIYHIFGQADDALECFQGDHTSQSANLLTAWLDVLRLKIFRAVEHIARSEGMGIPQVSDYSPVAQFLSTAKTSELISLAQMQSLCNGMVAMQTVRNNMRGCPEPIVKQSGQRPAYYGYQPLREWFVDEWPDTDHFIPLFYSDAKEQFKQSVQSVDQQ